MANNQDGFSDHLTFSQCYGYEPLPGPMRLEELSGDLRREVWNAVRELLIEISGQLNCSYHFTGKAKLFIQRILGTYYKVDEDKIEVPEGIFVEEKEFKKIALSFKKIIKNSEFNKVLDFLVPIINDQDVDNDFGLRVAALFDRHAAAYWLDTSRQPYHFFPQSSKEQGEATRQDIKTLHDNNMDGAAAHLRQAAEHINAQQYPDSVRYSISSIESVARQNNPESNPTGKALDDLEKNKLLTNKELKAGFKKIYDYTNSEPGVRHALVFKDSSNVSLDEAMFMYGACASFSAYLAKKHRQINAREANTECRCLQTA